MTGEYQRAFGRFPEDASFAPLQRWQAELRQNSFDADTYVFLGHVEANGATGHGGIRFGEDGWAWLVGLGKIFGRKTGLLPWGFLDYIEIRRDPFSIVLGNAHQHVFFIANAEGQSFGLGEMADVLVPRFDRYLDGGNWVLDEAPVTKPSALGATTEAIWTRVP